ncbi:MAG: NCS1 family nucleobase:cation symporter-1 [Planctomycetes bacterium]|nr:NCS1 family nucleobase:cation symporter-1 [Planctomycetota bacterium]
MDTADDAALAREVTTREATTREVGGLVELLERPSDPRLHNPDLDPTGIAQRTWGAFNMATLWVGMAVCIPTYMLAATLVQSGMTWWQAMAAILLGNVIVLVPMVLNAHAGTRYGIPFPVFARASFGVHGSHVPSLARALVACGWFGIQTYIGGEAISLTIGAVWPGWLELGGGATFIGLTLPSWVCFALFWAVNVFFVWRGHESIKWLESLAAPFLILVGLVLLGWAARRGGGLGAVLEGSSALVAGSGKEGLPWLLGVFLPGVTAMVGFWATLSLNIPDFTRYCRSQRDQLLGQALGLPLTMVLFSFIGVAVTSATLVIYGEAIWDPVVLVTRLAKETGSATLAALSTFALAVATLSTNIAANIVGPANSISNAFPRKVSFRLGGLIAAALGVALCPWLLLGQYIGWLVTYSGLLGAVGGVLIGDYVFVRRTRLDLAGLYRVDGPYHYRGGFNLSALAATAAGIGVVLLGKVVPGLEFLFDGAWFSGALTSLGLYVVLMRGQAKAG